VKLHSLLRTTLTRRLSLGLMVCALLGNTLAMLPTAHAASSILPPIRPVGQQVGAMQGLLGIELATRGQLIAAEPLLVSAVKVMPTDKELLTVYGMVLDGLDRQEAAQSVWKRLLAFDPDNIQAYYGLARLEERQKQFDQAIVYLEAAVRRAPNNAQLHYDLGVLYATLEQFKPSALHTQEAIALGLRNAESLNNYGYSLAHIGQFSKAHEAIDDSLKLEPDSASTLDSKGFVFYQQSQYAQALVWYNKAIAQDPSIGEIYYHRAQAHEKLNRLGEALDDYATYLELTPLANNRKGVEKRMAVLKDTLKPAGKLTVPVTNGGPMP
jgi:tetratricopeptide (TPR) repeat protein